MLEGVGNPDNVGGLFRTAAALGAGGLLVGRGTADPLYRKAVRTSMGAVLHLPWTSAEPWPGVLGRLRARGYRIAALTPRADATSRSSASPRRAAARVVPAARCRRRRADDRTSLALADDRVRIPIERRGGLAQRHRGRGGRRACHAG